ncbi:MAG: type I DNA topoisomerase [Chloroflexi bacterium AL-W]|nr:type I DNA topoisomerase [Chloroflexi bacterium AL-N1]NOK65743.1 type I DNA topoisomerase [Chloroflexi bacterium AL-N10]NOK74316.1 type I DNA topoisomerase [Chloroflexi bacterium AL-N5]NOK80776.1 type I DNA topoisomerase [Chloroflexi bacterium AL-W]NOK88574.1 type I DNA topoisomerase [Chloroflexi bacterium AL-N15]
MAGKLVIVESPAKARTIQKYLGRGFKVEASMGHVRDLPKSDLGVNIEDNFAPVYEVAKGKEKVVATLKKSIRQADAIYLATDPDREGEAIAWHITQAANTAQNTPVYRVVFNEITRNSVQQAIANPRQINANLVNAQQARRVLDRLVGYKLSPLLWDKVRRGLSAGRVQSVAVRLTVEREQEIEIFVPREYWTIEAELAKQAQRTERKKKDIFRATLIERAGKKLDKFAIGDQDTAQTVVTDLQGAAYIIRKIVRKDKKRSPTPPFTTSTLQQEAGRKLGFSAKRTMIVAQQLYEGIDIGGDEGTVGLITYMRTDSVSVAKEAQDEARKVIQQLYGDPYIPEKTPTYRTKAKNAQEAHEAIRPTSSQRNPEALRPKLSNEQFRLYDLIWKRFVASQMTSAIFDSTTVDIAAGNLKQLETNLQNAPYVFRATGSILKFPGFLAVYNVSLDDGEEDEDSEKRLPALQEQELLDLLQLLPIQHFTEPQPRFTEASLVKELERLGIGRPSTYAPTISTIIDREYVEVREKKLIPTTLGRIVTELLVDHFPRIVDYGFTSALEQQLDDIAEGTQKWVPVLQNFYTPFEDTLARAKETMRNVKLEDILTDITCLKCNQGQLAIKFGRNGEFLACNRYPDCDFTSDFERNAEGRIVLKAASAPETSDVMCDVCGKPMVIKKSRFGPFLGCSKYPQCKNTRRIGKDGKPVPLPEPTGVTCPKCNEGEMMKRRGRFGRPFYGCKRYPKCDFIVNDLTQATPEAFQAAMADEAKNAEQDQNGQTTDNDLKTTRAAKQTTTSTNGATKKRSTSNATRTKKVTKKKAS